LHVKDDDDASCEAFDSDDPNDVQQEKEEMKDDAEDAKERTRAR